MNVNVSGHGNNNGTSNNNRSPRQSQGGSSHHHSHKGGVIFGFLRHVSGSAGQGQHVGGGITNNHSPGGHSIGGHSMGGQSMGGVSMRSGSVRESRKVAESGTMSSVHSFNDGFIAPY